MNKIILVLNIVSVFVAVYWIHFLLNKVSGLNNIYLAGTIIFGAPLIIITVVAIILSHRVNSNFAIMWATIPIIVFIIGIILMIKIFGIVASQSFNDKREKEIPVFLSTFSKDYTCVAISDKNRHDFITHDVENDILMYITSGNGYVHASPLGKIQDNFLNMFYQYNIFAKSEDNVSQVDALLKYKELFNDCYDLQGKNIFYKYDVAYKPEQNIKEYDLSKYDKYKDTKGMSLDSIVGPYEVYRKDYIPVLMTGLKDNK